MLTAPYKVFMGADPGNMQGVIFPTQTPILVPMVVFSVAQGEETEQLSLTAEDSGKLVVATLQALAAMGSSWASMMLDANRDINELEELVGDEDEEEDEEDGDDLNQVPV
jgi:hypothetical protein